MMELNLTRVERFAFVESLMAKQEGDFTAKRMRKSLLDSLCGEEGPVGVISAGYNGLQEMHEQKSARLTRDHLVLMKDHIQAEVPTVTQAKANVLFDLYDKVEALLDRIGKLPE